MKTLIKIIEMKYQIDITPYLIYGSLIAFFIIAYLIIAPDPSEVHLRNIKTHLWQN